MPLLASALQVHEEQLAGYGAKYFFDSESATQLANCMIRALDGELSPQPYAYHQDVLRFAEEFMNIVQRIS